MTFLRMTDLPLAGQRVFIREDFNVPLDDAGRITDDTRIRAALPGIGHALAAGARLMLTSHLGRPTEGQLGPGDTLAPVAQRLGELLGRDVPLVRDWIDGFDPTRIAPGNLVLLENCRANKGEKSNADDLARKMASLCDVFVMDAFGTAHRAEATTHGIARFAPVACAGPLLAAELDALGRALANPKRPLVAIVAGSKVSTKLTILENLVQKVDVLIVGGGIANTFLCAQGHPIGKSLAEPDLAAEARRVLELCAAKGVAVPLPTDVVCAKTFSETATPSVKPVDAVVADDLILDIGPVSAQALATHIQGAGTIVWNGPVGVFEMAPFSQGTRALAEAIAASPAFSIAGGGDTLAAIHKFGIEQRIGHISTGGGAFLEFLEGKKLPAVEILEQRAGASSSR